MGKRKSAMQRIRLCTICGVRINRMNGIGYTADNPNYRTDPDHWNGPLRKVTCSKHDGVAYSQ